MICSSSARCSERPISGLLCVDDVRTSPPNTPIRRLLWPWGLAPFFYGTIVWLIVEVISAQSRRSTIAPRLASHALRAHNKQGARYRSYVSRTRCRAGRGGWIPGQITAAGVIERR